MTVFSSGVGGSGFPTITRIDPQEQSHHSIISTKTKTYMTRT